MVEEIEKRAANVYLLCNRDILAMKQDTLVKAIQA
jgi:hypothetical protein